MFTSLRNERGNWTLIGLLVAVAAGMLLYFLVLMPNMNKASKAEQEGLVQPKQGQTVVGASMDKAKETECMSNLRQIREMITYEKTQRDASQPLPQTLTEMKISASIQRCPVSGQPYSYNPSTGVVQCTTSGHEKL